MANLDATMMQAGRHEAATPRIRSITTQDLRDALARGWEDFKAKPSHLVFLALIYPVAGVLLGQLTVSYDIIRSHGGRIGYRRSASGGAVFFFELPIVPAEELPPR